MEIARALTIAPERSAKLQYDSTSSIRKRFGNKNEIEVARIKIPKRASKMRALIIG